jgi:hypothetical protein
MSKPLAWGARLAQRLPRFPTNHYLGGVMFWVVLQLMFFCPRLALLYGVVVVPTDFNRLVDEAECIFKGRVVSRQSQWETNGSDRLIVTVVSLQVERVLKGQVSSRFDLWQAGGTVGDTSLSVPGFPGFEPGEEVILFVKGNGQWICPLVGIFHGKYGLKEDKQTGRRIVVQHDGKPLTSVAGIGQQKESDSPTPASAQEAISSPVQPSAAPGPVSEDEFIQSIQKRLRVVSPNR